MTSSPYPVGTLASAAFIQGPSREYPRESTVDAVIREEALRRPEAIACLCGTSALRYGELVSLVDRMAEHLRQVGVRPDDRVGLCASGSINRVIAILGILRVGAAYVPIEPTTPAPRIAEIVTDAGLRVVIADSGVAIPSGTRRVILDEPEWRKPCDGGTGEIVAGAGGRAMYVMFTSGSTGRPKGVVVRHQSVLNLLCWAGTELGLGPGDRVLQLTSVAFDVSVMELFAPLMFGAVLVIPSGGGARDPRALAAEIRSQGITHVFMVPSLLRVLLEDGRLPGCTSLKAVHSTGEPLPTRVRDAFQRELRIPLYNWYGPTEATVFVTWHRCANGEGPVWLGRPVPNAHVAVLDAELRGVEVGGAGELCVGGDCLADGYLGRADLTEKVFIRDPFRTDPANRLYRTGDRVRLHPGGALEFLGRMDRQVKVRGHRVELGEVEVVLGRHPAVREAAVEFHPGGDEGGRLMAHVEAREVAGLAGELAVARVEEWRLTHDETYRQSIPADPRFDTSGWRSQVDRRAYTAAEMEEWVALTVERVRALGARRILEIGCGSGLLLHRLAPGCERYVGTDFSPAVVERLRRSAANLPCVEVWERRADDWSGVATGDFDLILINSVIQYFPDAGYLSAVLERALKVVDGGGAVFVGDVRSLGLLPAWHAHRLLSQASDSLPVAELRRQVEAACEAERELVCSPEFFRDWAAGHPRRPGCRILVKHGVHATEMNLFRYDVVLTMAGKGDAAPPVASPGGGGVDGAKQVAFGQERDALSHVEENFEGDVVVRGVPDARLQAIVQVLEWIRGATDGLSCGELRRRRAGFESERIDPHRWVAEAASEGGSVRMTNEPVKARWRQELGVELRGWVARHLPEAMVPATVHVLDALPRTPNGKLDRQALAGLRRVASPRLLEPPRAGLEEEIARLFGSVLGVEQVGRTDDFFALGGHSLLAFQLQNRVASVLGRRLELTDLFESPTVAGLAGRLAAGSSRSSVNRPLSKPAQGPGRSRAVSLLQEPLWNLDRMHGRDSLVHVAAAFRLRGPLDPRSLDEAFARMTDRHEALRSRFEEREGRLVREEVAWAPSLECVRLRGRVPRELEERVEEAVRRPFDLQTGPLVRAVLMEVGPEDHALVVVMHHMVSDAWSMPVFFRELAELYASVTAGRAPRLPDPSIQYGDFAVWQRAALESGEFEASIGHWRERLAGVASWLEIPPDFERPRVARHAGATLRRRLGVEVADPVRRLARANDCTLFPALLSAFLVVLGRYTGRDDLLIGTPVAGRTHAELEGLVGLFTNIVPLRADLSGDPDTAELLRRVRGYTLEALRHQELPFERLLAALGPARDPSRPPLVQVQFVLQNIPECVFALDGVTTEPVAVSGNAAAFDLTLEITERADGGLDCGFEYRTSLYTAETIGRFADRFEAVLRGMCARPELPIVDLPLMSAAERARVLVEWNQTGAAFPEGSTLAGLFVEQAARSAAGCAVMSGGESLGYAELDRRSGFLAQRLRSLGLRAGDACGVCLERSIHLPVAYLAVLKAGGTCLPLDPALPDRRLQGLLADSGATMVVTESGLEGRWAAEGLRRLSVDRFDWGRVPESVPPLPEAGEAGRVAFLIYTSGSSGTPKGVQVLHQGLVNCVCWLQRQFPMGNADRILQNASIGFDVSLAEIFWPLLHGSTLVLARPGGHRDPAYLVEEIQRSGITRVILTASMLGAVLDLPESVRCTSLTAAFSTGEALPPAVMRAWQARWRVPLHNLYGPTETTVFSTWWTCPREGIGVRIGRPIANTQLYIVDRRGHPLPVDVAGELVIGGVGVTAGYRNLPERTARSFVPGLLPEAAGVVYRTGDLARFRSDGSVEYLGRLDDQIKLRGMRVEPGEVEHALRLHPGVRDAAVVLREVAPGDVRIVAFVVPADPAAIAGVESLRTHLKAHLHPTLVPGQIVFRDALPKTGSGKLDRKAMREGTFESAPEVTEAEAAPAATVGARAIVVAGIFARVLGLPAVEVDGDFFDLGGHSILAIRIANEVNAHYAARLSVAAIFRNPTPAAIAAELDRTEATSTPPAR